MKLQSPDGTAAMPALGLVIHPSKPVDDSVATIIRWAVSHSVEVVGRSQDRDRTPPDVETLPDDEFVDRVSGVLALGGDGTMLGAMRLVIGRPVPVLGINHGNLGFLVEVTPATLESSLARLIDGDFTVEAHSCLVAESTGVKSAGFNDIVLASGRAGAVSVDLTVDGLQYGYYKCDALVLSTPSGSTAYNYAAGGPVVSPSASVVVVTPVAPMAGISRSVVLGAEDRISLHVAAESAPVEIDIDGTPAGQLAPDGVLDAYLREDAAQVVRFSAGEHASRSRVKLSLLDVPLRRDQLLELIPGDLRAGNEPGR